MATAILAIAVILLLILFIGLVGFWRSLMVPAENVKQSGDCLTLKVLRAPNDPNLTRFVGKVLTITDVSWVSECGKLAYWELQMRSGAIEAETKRQHDLSYIPGLDGQPFDVATLTYKK
jgi:hypothetical protein